MAISVQTQQGTTQDANSYASVATMRSFHTARGVALAQTDAELEQALVRATDFMDARYAFVGSPLNPLQGTSCPRLLPTYGASVYLRDLNTNEPAYQLTTKQWKAVERACVQLAYRALTSSLLPDPTRDASGQRVSKKSVKAGPVETSREFAEARSADDLVPSYPEVDLLLRSNGLLAPRTGGSVARA